MLAKYFLSDDIKILNTNILQMWEVLSLNWSIAIPMHKNTDVELSVLVN